MATEPWRTVTVPGAEVKGWVLQERVIGFRVFGTKIEKPLPDGFDVLTIGSAPESALRFQHDSVSRSHAIARFRGGSVLIEEVTPPPKNGTYYEGERRSVFQVVPGTWFALGGLSLIAYSAESKRVSDLLAHHLGYGEAAQLSVDRAYIAATRYRHIAMIAPPGAWLPLARAIHEETSGRGEPKLPATKLPPTFHVAPPLRDSSAADQVALLKRASRHMLVVPADHLPEKPSAFLEMIQSRTYEVRLVLVVPPGGEPGEILGPTLWNETVGIHVPALAERAAEIPRVVEENVAAQHGRLEASEPVLRRDDLEVLSRQRWPGNIEEVEDCVAKMIACRLHGSTRKAADALGYRSPGTLSKWAKKYGVKL
jgi:hypothetical protein